MAITVSNLLAYVENKTQAGVGTLNNTTTGVPMLNEALFEFRTELIKRGVDAAQVQEAYVPTVSAPPANQGSTFAWPADMFALKTIEVNMTDGTQQNFLQAQPLSEANTPGQASFDYLRVNQPTNNPLFSNRGDTYEIFPSFAYATNFTNAIHIFYYLNPVPYVNLSDVLVYPDTLNWYALADRVASVYYESLNKFNEASIWTKKSDSKIDKMVTTLGKQSDQPIQPQPLPMTGWNF